MHVPFRQEQNAHTLRAAAKIRAGFRPETALTAPLPEETAQVPCNFS
jgi:hypothetical protein